MSIFNSLGSNYNFQYILKSLFSDTSGQNQKLKNFLEEKYNGKTILTYKGREALTLALKVLNLPKESLVAINGFTCFAVYKAIEKAGCKPLCLDLEEKNSDLNFNAETLEKALKGNKNIKIVVIQNTLGYPCDIEKISEVCEKNNLILIEDLAHCIGTKYANGKEAGSVGDFVILSFSQDKVIDAVSGGALIDRHSGKQSASRIDSEQARMTFAEINRKQQLKDRLYPLLTYKIRFLYDWEIGKVLHYILKNLNLLSKPMQENLYDLYSLPNWHCNLALTGFKNLSHQLNHRKKIAQIYAKNLNKKILSSNITGKISLSSNLRFPIFVENRGELIKFLKNSKIFISDIWHDDVAPECPNAVNISRTILNLPTHINIQEKDAIIISERINQWLKSQ